jgi:hypothetical protein
LTNPDPKPENTLQELFNRDPLKLTDQDLSIIVAKFREQRSKWNIAQVEEKAPKTPKVPKTPKKSSITLSEDDLSLLNDLEIKV